MAVKCSCVFTVPQLALLPTCPLSFPVQRPPGHLQMDVRLISSVLQHIWSCRTPLNLSLPLHCKCDRATRLRQADVYSFAMICYELFEGRKPFSEMNASAAARAASLFDRRPPWGKLNR